VAAIVLAAALTAAAFGAGFLVADRSGGGEAFEATRVVPMHGAGGTQASIRLGRRDVVGNLPMELIVSGLPEQAAGAYYELLLTRNGKPRAPCGGFRVHGKTTIVRFTVPYQLKRFDGWVIAVWPKGARKPGRVVLSTHGSVS
jgi:hypothetical protein